MVFRKARESRKSAPGPSKGVQRQATVKGQQDFDRTSITSATTTVSEYEAPALKQKHLNHDCPHLVPLDFQVINYEYDEDYTANEERVELSWLGRCLLFCGLKLPDRNDKDETDSIVSGRSTKRRWWSIAGFSCVIIVALAIAFRHSPYGLTALSIDKGN